MYNQKLQCDKQCDHPINSVIRCYEEIRRLTTGQGEDYTNGCLLHCNYTKNLYRLIAVDLSTQNKLDPDPKAIQQKEFIGQFKKTR